MADIDSTDLPAPASSPPSLPYDPDPVTPTDPPGSTPALASPDTPYAFTGPGRGMGDMEHLQTPAGPQAEDVSDKREGGKRQRGLTIVGMEDVDQAEDGVGLGFGDIETRDVVLGDDAKGSTAHTTAAKPRGQPSEAVPPSALASRARSRSVTPSGAGDGFPELSTLRKMQSRLAEIKVAPSDAHVKELSQMVSCCSRSPPHWVCGAHMIERAELTVADRDLADARHRDAAVLAPPDRGAARDDQDAAGASQAVAQDGQDRAVCPFNEDWLGFECCTLA